MCVEIAAGRFRTVSCILSMLVCTPLESRCEFGISTFFPTSNTAPLEDPLASSYKTPHRAGYLIHALLQQLQRLLRGIGRGLLRLARDGGDLGLFLFNTLAQFLDLLELLPLLVYGTLDLLQMVLHSLHDGLLRAERVSRVDSDKSLEDDLRAQESKLRDLEDEKATLKMPPESAKDSLSTMSDGWMKDVAEKVVGVKQEKVANYQQNIDTAQTAIKDKTDALAAKRAEVQKKQEDLAKAAAGSSGGGSSKRPSSGNVVGATKRQKLEDSAAAVVQLLTDQGILVPGVHYTTCDDGTHLPRAPSWVEHVKSSWVVPGNSNVSPGVVSQAAKFIGHVCKPKPARIDDILKRLPDPHASHDEYATFLQELTNAASSLHSDVKAAVIEVCSSFDPNGDGYLPGIRNHKGLRGFIDRAFGYGPFMDSAHLKFPLPVGFGLSDATLVDAYLRTEQQQSPPHADLEDWLRGEIVRAVFCTLRLDFAVSLAVRAVIVDEKRELPSAPESLWGGVQPLHESLHLFRVMCDKWSAVLKVPGEVVKFTLDHAKMPTSVEKVVQAVEAPRTKPGRREHHLLYRRPWFAIGRRNQHSLFRRKGVLLAENDEEDEDLDDLLHVYEKVVSADGEDEDVLRNGDPDSSGDDDATSVSSTPAEVDDRLRRNRIQARINEEREF
ncbi:hypothetical protein PG995_011416 [Apiospora arundinis]